MAVEEVAVVEIGAAGVAAAAVAVLKTKTKTILPRQDQSTRVLNIQIYQPETGPDAVCISSGGKMLFSVPNPPAAHGRMFTPPSLQTSETLTSSVHINSTL